MHHSTLLEGVQLERELLCHMWDQLSEVRHVGVVHDPVHLRRRRVQPVLHVLHEGLAAVHVHRQQLLDLLL